MSRISLAVYLLSQVRLGMTLYDMAAEFAMQPFSVPIQVSRHKFRFHIALRCLQPLLGVSVSPVTDFQYSAGLSNDPLGFINRLLNLIRKCLSAIQPYFQVSYRALDLNYLVSNTHVHLQGDMMTGDH